MFRVVRLRRRQARRHGAGGLVFLSGVILILVLLNHAPYRIFYGDRFERLEINGFRCYDIGQHDDELLVYCPDTDPPRNRVIKRDDPTLNRLGIVESVFTPAPGSRSGS